MEKPSNPELAHELTVKLVDGGMANQHQARAFAVAFMDRVIGVTAAALLHQFEARPGMSREDMLAGLREVASMEFAG